MKEELVVKKLIENNETISSMESCTAGYFATTLTNVDGSSSILKYSAITYSNEFKIKMGVASEIIDNYSVYSTDATYGCYYFFHSVYSYGLIFVGLYLLLKQITKG